MLRDLGQGIFWALPGEPSTKDALVFEGFETRH